MKVPGGDRSGTLGAEEGTSALAEAVDRISHQLKNPLQAMTVNLEVVRLHARKGEADEVERAADVVDENVRKVDRRIRMLVALARRSPEDAATGLELGRLIREADGAFRLAEGDDGAGLELRLPDEEEGGGALEVRAREGELLALLLAAASRSAEAASSGERAYLSLAAVDAGVVLEIGPGPPWRSDGEREELFAQARRAFGEPSVPDGETGPAGDGEARGPFRVRFPRP